MNREKFIAEATKYLDVKTLEANLDRSVAERLRRHDKALRLVQKLRNAKAIRGRQWQERNAYN